MDMDELEEKMKNSLRSALDIYRHILISEDNLDRREEITEAFDEIQEEIEGKIEEGIEQLDEMLK